MSLLVCQPRLVFWCQWELKVRSWVLIFKNFSEHGASQTEITSCFLQLKLPLMHWKSKKIFSEPWNFQYNRNVDVQPTMLIYMSYMDWIFFSFLLILSRINTIIIQYKTFCKEQQGWASGWWWEWQDSCHIMTEPSIPNGGTEACSLLNKSEKIM